MKLDRPEAAVDRHMLALLAATTALPVADTLGKKHYGWSQLHTTGAPHGRDEAGFFEFDNKLCLIGGRGKQTIDCYDPKTQAWSRSMAQTDNIHHLQPVVWGREVYIVSAWNGNWPSTERDIKDVLIYSPDVCTGGI